MNKVEVYSHFFTVTKPSVDLRRILYNVAADYTVLGMVYDNKRRKRVWRPIKTFGFYTEGHDVFRFHNGQLGFVLSAAESKHIHLDVVRKPIFTPYPETYKVREKFKLRPDQEEASSFIMDGAKTGNITPLLSMPTGTGKTVTSLVTASRIGHRLSVSVLAGYVDKWVGDLIKTYEIEDSEIYRIEGRKSLVDYCQMVLEHEKTPEKMPRATVISLNTIGKWQKKYIDNPADPELAMYGMKPWELMEKAKIGTNIFDENHQHLHAVYRMFTFLHIPQTISLSATLLSEDQTELRIQRMMYPRENRFEKIKMKKYIEVFACQYQIADLANARIQTTERGSNAYNHGAFEKSILANRTIRQQYIDMITRMVKGAFVETREDQDKCIVFVSSHAMAKEVCRQLKAIYPDKDIRTYLEEDPLDNLMEPEICVTTVLSGGTAHDIPNLTVSIQTISLNSIKSNLQVLGRLREIPGKSTRFYYLYCSSIPKQVEYHTNKLTMFKDRCKEHKELILEPIRPKLGQNQQFHQHKFKQY